MKSNKTYKQFSAISAELAQLVLQTPSHDTLRKVNNLQRSLADLATNAFNDAAAFTEDFVGDVSKQLQLAAQYLQGSVYWERALERCGEFPRRAQSWAHANRAFEEWEGSIQ